MNNPTPETDREESHGFDEWGGDQTLVSADFARKLERERDEALKEADKQTEIANYMTDYMPDAKRELGLIKQRDEARNLAERLAKYVSEVKKAYEFEQNLHACSSVNNLEILQAEELLTAYEEAKEGWQ